MSERSATEPRDDVMPAGWAYYTTTREPTRYRDVTFQLLFFDAAPEAIAALLPPEFAPEPERPVVAVAIDVPESSSYGPFRESFLELPCAFGGAPGYYCGLVFLDNVRAIVAGREIWGTPKVFARVTFHAQDDRIVSRTEFDGDELIEVVTTTDRAADPAEIPPTAPSYRLKLIPAANGTGFAVKQVTTADAIDPVLSGARRGSGVIRLGATRGLDLTPLTPARVRDAFSFRMTYQESFGRIVHDYLK